MKSILTISFLLVCSSFIYSQIVINEIYFEEGYVELKNVSGSPVDISDYYLSSGNDEVRVGSHFPFCGSVNLAPGAIFMISAFSDLNWNEGEMILFNNEDLTDPSGAIDYVEWGDAGHSYELIAVTAGIWTAGDFVESILEGGSLEYDGDGDSSLDWSPAAAPSGCEENGTGCEVGVGTVFGEDPYVVCIGNEFGEYFQFSFFGNLSEFQRAVVLDGDNRILGFSSTSNYSVDLEYLTESDTTGIHVVMLGHNGPIGNLEVGVLLEDVIGCFAYSQSFPISVSFQEAGTLEAIYNDTLYTDLIELCSTDNIPDVVKFTNTSPDDQIAFLLVNDVTNRVIDIGFDSLVVDFDALTETELFVRSFSYTGTFSGNIGDHYSSVTSSLCTLDALNDVIINGEDCINSSSNPDKLQASLTVYPNPVSNSLNFTKTNDSKWVIYIYNTLGKCVLTQMTEAQAGNINLDVQALSPGMYIIHNFQDKTVSRGTFIKAD
ncbi:MAG TPA: T9SS type A sorting domain-containing protein [Saprospiraceae bacterium]|nr:T9SS type A sorting domain-containing protein [Saprospiraceae bacterium]